MILSTDKDLSDKTENQKYIQQINTPSMNKSTSKVMLVTTTK